MSLEIEKIAHLARLKLKPEEKQKIEKDLASILKYVEKLNNLNVEKVEPTSHVLDAENVFRPDVVKPSDARDSLLKHAPDAYGKFFKVPKVVDKES